MQLCLVFIRAGTLKRKKKEKKNSITKKLQKNKKKKKFSRLRLDGVYKSRSSFFLVQSDTDILAVAEFKYIVVAS